MDIFPRNSLDYVGCDKDEHYEIGNLKLNSNFNSITANYDPTLRESFALIVEICVVSAATGEDHFPNINETIKQIPDYVVR